MSICFLSISRQTFRKLFRPGLMLNCLASLVQGSGFLRHRKGLISFVAQQKLACGAFASICRWQLIKQYCIEMGPCRNISFKQQDPTTQNQIVMVDSGTVKTMQRPEVLVVPRATTSQRGACASSASSKNREGAGVIVMDFAIKAMYWKLYLLAKVPQKKLFSLASSVKLTGVS